MSFECVGKKVFSLGESPRWHDGQKKLFMTDLHKKQLLSYDPAAKQFTVIPMENSVSGFCFNRDGRVVCSTHTGVYMAELSTGKMELIANEVDGEYLKCNDCAADSQGRFVFGSSFFDPGINQGALGNLYVMDKDRTIRKVDEGIVHSNGMVFSPDGKLFYYTDCAARILYVYDYDAERGVPENRRVFATIGRHMGIPDGMAVDAEGYVWSAQWYDGMITRYAPDGSIDCVLRSPAMQSSALAFGGEDHCDIYVTSCEKWAELDIKPPHYEFDALYPGGDLYKFNFGIAGQPTFYTDIH